MSPPARLITIPFSHYCEKARWALDRGGVPYVEDGHLPIFHAPHARRARRAAGHPGGGRSVPVLVTDAGTYADSTEIAAYVDGRRPGTLRPADPAARAEALALEDELDRQLGPAARRWAYHHLLPNRAAAARLAVAVPRWEYLAFRAARPLAVAMLRRAMAITPAGVARSQLKLDAAFALIDDRLGDGRRYLVGDRFTIADLTFAALAAPVLLPAEQPFRPADLADFPAAAQPELARWRGTRAGAFALRMYRDERATSPSP
jgi:glutathione S-transferase